jgi:hypothetical protein
MNFYYVGFIAQQVLGIIGFQIEAYKVFNIVGIHTNLWHSWLGMGNFEMIINTYVTWSNHVQVGVFHPWKNSWIWKKR